MSEQAQVYLQRDGAIGWLILNRPERRNAMNIAMWRAIPALIAEAEADPAIRVIIVAGYDSTAFSAGADIAEFEALMRDPSGWTSYSADVRNAEQAIGNAVKPTIAMIRGVCFGGGVEISLACDLRFAGSDCRFGITPAKLGLVYSLTSTRRLVDLMGPAKTKDLLFSGRRFAAAEAAALGLLDHVFEPAAVEAETRAYAAGMTAMSQYSVRATKQIVRAIVDGATDETPETFALKEKGFDHEDTREGIRAFFEKRPPRF